MDNDRAAVESMVRRIPLRRKALYVATIWIGLLFVAEIGSRIGGYLIYEHSPFFLFYGIKSFMADADPEGHSAAFDGYFKFPPSRTLHQYGLFSKPTPIRINARGFRGAEFNEQKGDSVLRVICLGESSTFGFFDTDEGTYPAILERLLNGADAERARKRYEVINAGIPHANSDNMLAMFQQELLTYNPDVLTLYAGFNDAAALMSPNALHRVLTWLHGHFASYVAFKRLVTAVGGPELPSRWSIEVSGSDSNRVNRQVRLHVDRYRANVDRIVKLAMTRGVRVVLVKQALRPGWGDTTGLTYGQKVARAQATLAAGRRITSGETTMMVHSALMRILDSIGTANSLGVLDNIAVVDDHPEYLASYVHLTEAGNLALASLIQRALRGSPE